MFCMQCGTQLPPEALFCWKCGKTTESPIAGSLAAGDSQHGGSLVKPQWEYKELVLDMRSHQTYDILGTQVTLPVLRLEWWSKHRSEIFRLLQPWFDKGWEIVGGAGPDCLKIITAEKTDFLHGGPAVFNRNTYVLLTDVSIQLRRRKTAGVADENDAEVAKEVVDIVERCRVVGRMTYVHTWTPNKSRWIFEVLAEPSGTKIAESREVPGRADGVGLKLRREVAAELQKGFDELVSKLIADGWQIEPLPAKKM